MIPAVETVEALKINVRGVVQGVGFRPFVYQLAREYELKGGVCNTMNLGGSQGEWRGAERYINCGDCLLDYTGGICPLTACTKRLINSACGGASNGNCELSPDKDCGWELIYNRLKTTNRRDQLRKLIVPKDWSQAQPDIETMATSHYARERPS